MKTNQIKDLIENLAGCATTNFLKFQFEELRKIPANTKEFWEKALELVEGRYGEKEEKKEEKIVRKAVRVRIKKNLSREEKERIAEAIAYDSLGRIKISAEDVLYVVISEDIYNFHFQGKMGQILCQPIHSETYHYLRRECLSK